MMRIDSSKAIGTYHGQLREQDNDLRNTVQGIRGNMIAFSKAFKSLPTPVRIRVGNHVIEGTANPSTISRISTDGECTVRMILLRMHLGHLMVAIVDIVQNGNITVSVSKNPTEECADEQWFHHNPMVIPLSASKTNESPARNLPPRH